ncbi:RNA endoribonuclease [Podila verticillata]|nr:RNA endoribonuclease [Haplosporangium bisporale]KAF9387708.1 RNA endoribonuclease [Podila verticillata]
MTTELQLRLQHQQERESLIQEQGAEREQVLTQQQGRMQEQQAAYMQLQAEFQQDPTAAREHAILMAQQSIQHLQELFHLQQSHVLERHQHDQLRLQERQWHQEQLLLQQLHQQQLQQIATQPLSPSAHSPGQGLSNHYFGYQGQHPQQQPQHLQHHVHQHSPQQQQQPSLQQQQVQQPQVQQPQVQQPQAQQLHQQPQRQHSDTEAMDVDDEATLLSITSTISSLRQHSSRPDASSIGSWALDSASSDRNGFEAVVVLDTNVLLSHLNFLRSLVSVCDTKYNGTSSPTKAVFIVPWVVIQELDGLKMDRGRRGGEVDVVDKARRAIKYIQDELERPENRRSLRGQKVGECLEKRETNDDYILDCCQYFQSELGTDKKIRVTLFSNDRNLCVKAMIHEVATLSHGKIDFEIEPVMAAIFGAKSPKGTVTNGLSMETDASGLADSTHNPHNSSGSLVVKVGSGKGTYKTVVNQRELQRIKSSSKVISAPQGMDPRLFELTTHIIIRLRRYLEFAVPEHLKAYYGTEWKSRTKFDDMCTKPEDMQWDCRRLTHPISLLQTYWRPVFTDLYHSASQSNKARTHLDSLQTFIKTWDRVETFGLGKVYKKDLTSFLDDVDAILAGVLIKPPSSSSPTDLTSEDIEAREMMYDAATRIRTIKDWKTHCSMLE